MNISEIKKALGVETLPFEEGLANQDGTPSLYGTIWDNTTRRQVSILKTDLTSVIANPTRSDLYMHHSQPVSTGSGKMFDNYRIGIMANVIGTL